MTDNDAELAAAPSPPATRVLEIRFTGSGSEYFRIWAVNLLLILLSCGLYMPFAKVRRIRYLYANTLIDGEALAFHGDAWKMLRGFLLLALLMLVYTLAGEFSPAAALPAFLLLCAVWPALWRASLQFRLGNTSWRGLRMGFAGGLAGAYLAYLPVLVPVVLLVLMTPDGQDRDGGTTPWLWLPLLATALALPGSTALLKRYQHQAYRIAAEHSAIDLHTRSVYFIGFKSALVALLMLVVVIGGTVVLGGLLGLAHTGRIDANQGNGIYYGIAFVGLVYLLGGSVVLPYWTSRLQDLVWGQTYSASLEFRSELSGLMALTLKNWLLIVLTLGLYRPFAVIATARLRLQAVRIETRSEPDTWVSPALVSRADASGEVAGDFFGVDVGL